MDKMSKFFKKDLNLCYKRVKPVKVLANSIPNKIIRQWFAIKWLQTLEQGKIILNIDESSINDVCFSKSLWIEKNESRLVAVDSRPFYTSMIAGISSEGKLYYEML